MPPWQRCSIGTIRRSLCRRSPARGNARPSTSILRPMPAHAPRRCGAQAVATVRRLTTVNAPFPEGTATYHYQDRPMHSPLRPHPVFLTLGTVFVLSVATAQTATKPATKPPTKPATAQGVAAPTARPALVYPDPAKRQQWLAEWSRALPAVATLVQGTSSQSIGLSRNIRRTYDVSVRIE